MKMCASLKDFPKRILIIDDDIDLLMLLERKLQKEGYCTETAISLPEAEEMFQSFQPHLVLLYINVKGEDGRQLCWKLKMNAEDKPVKVIVITGYDCSTKRAVLFGADDLLPKPFHPDFLLLRLSEHLHPEGGSAFSLLSD